MMPSVRWGETPKQKKSLCRNRTHELGPIFFFFHAANSDQPFPINFQWFPTVENGLLTLNHSSDRNPTFEYCPCGRPMRQPECEGNRLRRYYLFTAKFGRKHRIHLQKRQIRGIFSFIIAGSFLSWRTNCTLSSPSQIKVKEMVSRSLPLRISPDTSEGIST